MTLALAWKELRGQWAVWVSLSLVVAAGNAALIGLLQPGRNRDEILVGVLWVAAWGHEVP